MSGCPHPYGLQVEGRCYWCLKQAATNGHRSRLSVDQLAFVGFLPDHEDPGPRAWVPAGRTTLLEQKEAELAALLDTMPGWFALARRIVEE